MTEYFKCLGCGATNPWSNRCGDGFCRTCFATAHKLDGPRTAAASDDKTAGTPRPTVRQEILKRLRSFIREPVQPSEPSKVSPREFDSPLAPFLK